MKASPKKEKDKSWIFLLLLALGVLVILFSSQEPENSKTPERPQVSTFDPERSKRVDSHMKDTAYNLEADQRQRQIEAYQQLNKLHSTNTQSAYKPDEQFSLESDPYMQSLTDDLDRSRSSSQYPMTPEEIVQQRLYENQQLNKASQAYREAYAEQFIENARKAGWEIELGPNFEVLSVKKLKEKKRQPSLFEDLAPGGGR